MDLPLETRAGLPDALRVLLRDYPRERWGGDPNFHGLVSFWLGMHLHFRDALGTMAAAVRFNNLKIAASEQAPRVCQGAMGVCGIVGFKNDTPFSVGRHLRDTMSAVLMVANERIHQTNAGLLLIAKEV